MNQKVEIRYLLFILILGLLLRLSFVFFVPMWQSADEYPHFYYIQYLSEHKSFPLSQPYFPSYQCFQPPLYYLVGSALYSAFKSWDSDRVRMGQESTLEKNGELLSISNPMGIFLRIVSVIFGVLIIYLTYSLNKMVFPYDSEIVLGATAFVAFLPTLVSNTASITNDPSAILLSVIAMFYLLNTKYWNFKQLFICGLVLGLGILTKYNLLALVPITFLALYFSSSKRVWYKFPAVMLFAILTCFFWIIHNLKAYHAILPINPGYILHDNFWNRNLNEVFHSLKNLFWSFWAASGRIYEVHFPAWYYILIFGGLSFLATIGLIKFFSKAIKNKKSFNLYQERGLILLAAYSILLFVGSLYYSLSYRIMTSWGKNLFPGIFAIALFFTLGMANLSTKYKKQIILLSVLVLVLSCLILLFFYLIPYYY